MVNLLLLLLLVPSQCPCFSVQRSVVGFGNSSSEVLPASGNSSQFDGGVRREGEWWNVFKTAAKSEMRKIERSISSIFGFVRDKIANVTAQTDSSGPKRPNDTAEKLLNGGKQAVRLSFDTAQNLAYKVPSLAREKLTEEAEKLSTANDTSNLGPVWGYRSYLISAMTFGNSTGNGTFEKVKNKTKESFDLANDIAVHSVKLAKDAVVKAKDALVPTKRPRFVRGFPFFFGIYRRFFF